MKNKYNFPNGLGLEVSSKSKIGRRGKATYKVYLLKEGQRVYNLELGFREERYGQSWDQVLDSIERVQYCNPDDYEFLDDVYLY